MTTKKNKKIGRPRLAVPNVQLSIYIEPEVSAWLKAEAKKAWLSPNMFIRQILSRKYAEATQ